MQNACGSAALAERLAHSQCELTYERKGVGCLLVKKLLRGLLSFALQQLLRPNIAAAQFHEGAGLLQVRHSSQLPHCVARFHTTACSGLVRQAGHARCHSWSGAWQSQGLADGVGPSQTPGACRVLRCRVVQVQTSQATRR